MKRYFVYGSIVLASYVVFLIAMFPAERAYALLKDKMPNVALYQLHGTIWSGDAQAAVINGKALRELSWSLKPLSLLMARLEAEIKFDNNMTWAKGSVALGLSGKVTARGLEGQIPAEELQTMLPNSPARLAGMMRVNMDKLVYSPEAKQVEYAQGHIEWQGATVTVMQEASIGDFQLDLSTTDKGIAGEFSDINDGPMQVAGNLSLAPDKQYKIDAKLKVRDTTRQDLVQSLLFLGQVDAEGNTVFNKAGAL